MAWVAAAPADVVALTAGFLSTVDFSVLDAPSERR